MMVSFKISSRFHLNVATNDVKGRPKKTFNILYFDHNQEHIRYQPTGASGICNYTLELRLLLELELPHMLGSDKKELTIERANIVGKTIHLRLVLP